GPARVVGGAVRGREGVPGRRDGGRRGGRRDGRGRRRVRAPGARSRRRRRAAVRRARRAGGRAAACRHGARPRAGRGSVPGDARARRDRRGAALARAGAVTPAYDPLPLRAARRARLRGAMAAADLDALVLTSAANVRYATGAVPLHGDASVEAARPRAAVLAGDAAHVVGVDAPFVPPDVEAHAASRATFGPSLAPLLGGARRVGFDRLTPAVAAALGAARLVPADAVVLGARAIKFAAEIALLRAAQVANEAAIAEVLPALVPGVAEVELTGLFLAAMARRGVTACHVEPIWCVVPRDAAAAPWTFPGGLPYRELTGARRLAAGDQVMIDTGMLRDGYMSDFGCTWTVGGPTAADRALRARWQAVVDGVLAVCRPGATAADLHRAARAADGGDRPAPWPVPLYLAHGLGLGGVEPPFVGTDLGLAAEERMAIAPGMVLVLEPYAWEEGRGAYRAEQTIAITDDGWTALSAPPP